MKTQKTAFLFIVLSFLCIFSCQKDNLNDQDSNVNGKDLSLTQKSNLETFISKAPQGVFFSEFNSKKDNGEVDINSNRCLFSAGYNNLDLCGYTNSSMGSVNILTSWNVLDNPAGYIDYELEDIFSYSCDFSYICFRPAGSPSQTIYVYGEADFYESPSYNPQNGQFDIYNYLGDNSDISIVKANELKEHFACKIGAYRDANYANFYISEVNFYGDVLLCGGATRFLRASFKLEKFGK